MSPMKLTSVAEALALLLEKFSPLDAEKVLLTDSLNRILAQDIYAPFSLPIFTNSSMDGFAVNADDVQNASPGNPIALKIVGDIPAGKFENGFIRSGETARIMTGSVIPFGADAVVPVEQTNMFDGIKGPRFLDEVIIFQPVKPGDYIRVAGEDVSNGELIFFKGHRLRPQDLGLLSMLGIDKTIVYRKPCVAIMSTGNELVLPGNQLAKGEILRVKQYHDKRVGFGNWRRPNISRDITR